MDRYWSYGDMTTEGGYPLNMGIPFLGSSQLWCFETFNAPTISYLWALDSSRIAFIQRFFNGPTDLLRR
jgi:hypothetical protein